MHTTTTFGSQLPIYLPPLESITKRALVSDIARTFDALGLFSPSIIKAKILLQRLWEQKIDWDDAVPESIREAWSQMAWRSELNMLTEKRIPRCYFPKEAKIISTQLHGFSDASELAYAGVVYLRMCDSEGNIHTCVSRDVKDEGSAHQASNHTPLVAMWCSSLGPTPTPCQRSSTRSPQDVHAWTDSTIVISWLDGNPRRFKTYVGNQVASIMELITPNQWKHVNGAENPADCASRGLFLSELLQHSLWWNGPPWLRLAPSEWPKQLPLLPTKDSTEERDVCLLAVFVPEVPVLDVSRYSSFTRVRRITAWIFRFVKNCLARKRRAERLTSFLTVQELAEAESYWLSISQRDHFATEVDAVKLENSIPKSSSLVPLHPIVDSSGLIRVGGREHNSKACYSSQHPIVLHGKHPVTKLIIRSEHTRLLHAGPRLLMSSINCRFHVIGLHKAVRSITRACITCRRTNVRPQPQMLGHLPMERVTPDSVFDRVGVDYAGPVYVKYGYTRKPTVIKSYICLFVSLSVKAVHLELVSDLSTDAFIASLRRFTARRGKPTLIWSDHGSNFVGAARELKELAEFQEVQGLISDFCTYQNIQWKFIPEHSPHFGGL